MEPFLNSSSASLCSCSGEEVGAEAEPGAEAFRLLASCRAKISVYSDYAYLLDSLSGDLACAVSGPLEWLLQHRCVAGATQQAATFAELPYAQPLLALTLQCWLPLLYFLVVKPQDKGRGNGNKNDWNKVENPLTVLKRTQQRDAQRNGDIALDGAHDISLPPVLLPKTVVSLLQVLQDQVYQSQVSTDFAVGLEAQTQQGLLGGMQWARLEESSGEQLTTQLHAVDTIAQLFCAARSLVAFLATPHSTATAATTTADGTAAAAGDVSTLGPIELDLRQIGASGAGNLGHFGLVGSFDLDVVSSMAMAAQVCLRCARMLREMEADFMWSSAAETACRS